MSCNRPITAYYSDKVNPETGKRSLVFNQTQRYRGANPEYASHLKIPCGRCLGCRADLSLMWSIRGYHESQMHIQNSFITLTYDDQHLPPDGKIDKTHLQKFFKRLRRDGTRFRYIACGEYGGTTRRPHYHAIIFGRDWLEHKIPINSDLYTAKPLIDTWGQGLVSIAPVTMASICYVCGYVNKKIDDPDTFNLMSRRPGIGHDWLDRYADDIARTGVVSIEGRSYQVPKRYLTWSAEMLAGVIAERKKYARERQRSDDPLINFSNQNGRESNLRSKHFDKNSRGKI